MTVSFSTDGKTLARSLQRLQTLSGVQLNGVLVNLKPKILEIHSEINSRQVLISLEADCNCKASFIINKNVIEAVCRKRDSIKFTRKDNKLHFTSGSFSGNLLLMPDAEDAKLLKLKSSTSDISQELQNKIIDAIRKCQLQSVYGIDKLSIFIQSNKSGLYLGIADQFHGNYVRISSDYMERFKKPFLLPSEYASILITQFKNASMDFAYQARHIVFSDENTVLNLPALQTQESLLEQLISIKVKYISSLDMAKLNPILQANALENAKLYVLFKKKSKIATVRFVSDSGNIEDQIELDMKVKRSVKLKLDSANFIDLVGKLKGSVDISYNSNTVQVRQGGFIGYSQLLQDNTDESS